MRHTVTIVSSLALALALAGSVAPAAEHEDTQRPQQQATQSAGTGEQAGAMSTGQTSEQSQSMQKRVGELVGMQVVNREGKRIGDVDKVVRRNQDGEPYAVISVGGFLDMGDKDIAVALDKVRVKEEKMLLPDDLETKLAIEDAPGWDRSRYKQIEDSVQVDVQRADFAAFESGNESAHESGDR